MSEMAAPEIVVEDEAGEALDTVSDEPPQNDNLSVPDEDEEKP